MLLQDPEFMQEAGARFFTNNIGGLALIGIGKVVPEDSRAETMLRARRIGEIRARTSILEMRDGIKISTSRGLKEGISLSSFFQVTETRVEGKIQQLPIIGTWWSPSRNIFYVAVGKMMDAAVQQQVLAHISPPLAASGSERLRLGEEGAGNNHDLLDMEGEEPFLSFVRISPVLCRNGGVRGFLFGKNSKALISVASALLKGSWAKTERIAQLKAVRSLLGHRKGFQLSSVEYLSDQEHLRLTEDEKRHVLISQFLSVQEEQVSGIIKSLPIVVTWKDPKGQVLYVAIGKLCP
ncbi:MAG: hypothetical protein L6406_05925 [Desulfobacterales bacterium]|nr:hypothetical protein [Desulfobacterales bacterium]